MKTEELRETILYVISEYGQYSEGELHREIDNLINQFKSDIINEFVEHTGDGDCAWWIEAKAREYLEPE